MLEYFKLIKGRSNTPLFVRECAVGESASESRVKVALVVFGKNGIFAY